jgi:hypothetical protein
MNHFTTDHPMASKQIQLSHRGWRVFQWSLIPFCALALYVGSFVWHFDIFSAPVRGGAYGWLGPAIRVDSHAADIGEVYDYEGTDFSLYRAYHPLCVVWLRVNGL